MIENWLTSAEHSERDFVETKIKRTILSREERLSFEHLGKYAPRTPDIYCNVVLLPREHDLGSPIIASRHVARHLRVLYSGEAKIANLNYRVSSLEVPKRDARAPLDRSFH